jgi:secondary thiamine-phosphate synthase enzyme
MDTLAPAPACRRSRIRVETRRSTEFIDLTDRIDASVSDTGIRDGLVNVHTLHTTTAILVNEHEPLLLADFAAVLDRMAPQHALYRHDAIAARTVNLASGERPNGHAHCRALLLGSSASLKSLTCFCEPTLCNDVSCTWR